jgi:ferredoxin
VWEAELTIDAPLLLFSSSRLGCQIKLTREVDGMVAQLPSATRNMYVDGESNRKGQK